jgi:hypothetical protein
MANPESVVYGIGETDSGNPCIVITTQQMDWDGNPVGQPSRARVTLQDIEQLVGFCVRCGNKKLFEAARRPFLPPVQR